MDESRFRRPKNADEEAAWLQETTPQNTKNSTNIILPSASSSFDPDISDKILASIDLPFSTSSLLSDLSDETQASLSLASGVDSIVTNVASNGTFNNCSINFILNSK